MASRIALAGWWRGSTSTAVSLSSHPVNSAESEEVFARILAEVPADPQLSGQVRASGYTATHKLALSVP